MCGECTEYFFLVGVFMIGHVCKTFIVSILAIIPDSRTYRTQMVIKHWLAHCQAGKGWVTRLREFWEIEEEKEKHSCQ